MQVLRVPPLIFLASFAAAVSLSGCGTMANGRGWGEGATLAPGWDRIGRAAWNAAASPATWGPAAGAIAFQAGHADRQVAAWASRSTPVFGSPERAQRASDGLKETAGILWIASAVAAPGGDDASAWMLNKTGGLAVQTGAGIALRGVVGWLKTGTDRTRPNGGDESFPSAHASDTALYATMTSRNLGTRDWPDGMGTAGRVGLGAMTAATAWARVEANQHYPSDVLAGIALGHFVGAFVTEAFLGIADPRRIAILFEPSRESVVLVLHAGF